MYNRYEQEKDAPRFESQPGQYGMQSGQYGEMDPLGHKGMNGILAFSLGALAGGVVALLLAPENARAKLRQGAGNLLHMDALKTQGKAVKDAFQTARETYQSEIHRSHEGESEHGASTNREFGSPSNPRTPGQPGGGNRP